MAMIGMLIILAAGILSLVYWIQILIIAFQTSVLWGLGSLFIGIIGLIFVAMHWEETKKPFLRSLLAFPLIVLGGILMAMGSPSH